MPSWRLGKPIDTSLETSTGKDVTARLSQRPGIINFDSTCSETTWDSAIDPKKARLIWILIDLEFPCLVGREELIMQLLQKPDSVASGMDEYNVEPQEQQSRQAIEQEKAIFIKDHCSNHRS